MRYCQGLFVSLEAHQDLHTTKISFVVGWVYPDGLTDTLQGLFWLLEELQTDAVIEMDNGCRSSISSLRQQLYRLSIFIDCHSVAALEEQTLSLFL